MMRIAITRPRDDGERTAAALRERGHIPLIAPLLRIEPVKADLRPHWGGVIITSANAANAIATHPARGALIKLPLFAIGRRSADAARQAGFSDISTADGDVHDLLRMLAARRAPAPLLYLAGEDRAADLVGELAAAGFAAELTVVYRAVAVAFPPQLIEALRRGEVDAVLHYSRRSAEAYLGGAERAGVAAQALDVRHFCLSLQIAAPLMAAAAAKVVVAPHPDEAALIASL